jgi:hypothetical protein
MFPHLAGQRDARSVGSGGDLSAVCGKVLCARGVTARDMHRREDF